MDIKTNLQYRDRLFRFIFGNEKYKKNTLALYNAVNGTGYSDEDELELTTLEDVIYIRMRNDVSLLLSGDLSLYEHQSTPNPNMPIRGLMYFANLYDKYIAVNRRNIYGSSLVMLPTPKYVVFYNGARQRPAVEKLRLSDAFQNEDTSGEFEWTATVLNLNHPDNRNLLDRCGILREYTEFVSTVQKYQKGMKNEEAVERAVTESIQKGGELAEILFAHKAEVVNMVLTEFNEEVFVNSIREEGRQEGIEEGRQEGIEETLEKSIRGMLKLGKLSVSDIAEGLNVPVQTVKRIAESVEDGEFVREKDG